jgi:glycosyltransferase involved in cell wall biosynthesis
VTLTTPPMRVVHILSNDCPGGLNHAAFRLHEQLLTQGIDSLLCVRRRQEQIDSSNSRAACVVRHPRDLLELRRRLDSIPAWLISGKSYLSLCWLPSTLDRTVAALKPDVIHVHQPHGAILSLPSLHRFGRPLVATLHDMWFFTGGCTFDGGCGRWAHACGNCPKVQLPYPFDASRLGHSLKRRAYARTPISFIAPSQWIQDCARSSSLLAKADVEHIPYGVDVDAFAPQNAETARTDLGLPRDAFLIAFVAHDLDDPRKGVDLAAATLAALSRKVGVARRRIIAVAIGGSRPPAALFPDGTLAFLGRLAADKLPQAYSACDVALVTSRQDNLPNVGIEAIACGTPVFGFDVGGLREISPTPRESLAAPFDVEALASLLSPLILDPKIHLRQRAQARQHACAKFAALAIGRRHEEFYERVIRAETTN